MSVSMKSAQISQTFGTIYSVANNVAYTPSLRSSMSNYENTGKNIESNWFNALTDLKNISSTPSLSGMEVYQIAVFDARLGNGSSIWVYEGTEVNGTYVGGVENPKYNGTISNGTRVDIGNAQGGPIGLLNVTGLNGIGIELPRSPENQGMGQMMKLPYRSPLPVDQEQEDKLFWQRVQKNITEGLPPNNGFTTELYPIASGYRNKRLRGDTSLIYTPQYIINMGGLLLGPVVINSTLSLLSFTIPIKKPDGQNGTQIVGFVTTVVSAKPLQEIISDTDGLGDTGQALLVGPAWVNGLWNDTRMSANKHSRGYVEDADKEIGDITSKITGDFEFVYLLRPAKSPKLAGKTFKLRYYDPVWILSTLGKGGTDLDTTNPLGESVAVGYTVPQIQENIPTLVDWGLLIEQGKSEAFEPISRLSHILYATVFSTFAVVMLIVWPLAHFSVQPILRLKRATENTTNCRSSLDSQGSASSHYDDNDAETGKICILCCFPNMQKRRKPADVKTVDDVRRRFRIPGKVKERKHFIHDELSSLTATYNQMTEELEMQYNTLEERVSQRTKALNEQTRLAEDHRKIAESANQAKSLFIANISHELRTPLGGMINMCDVAMEQAAAHSMIDVQESLQIAAMSGKSLLHLINELLTFSKNQVSVESQAEDEEFALVVIEKQLLAVFGKMAEERGVKLDVCNTPTDLLDHIFVADIKRITQCMYNLVGNGLKFTPWVSQLSIS